MAKKLSDDHLRIILDVEAKGIQAELQKIASSSIQLAEANKQMKNEMKDAEKQMNDCLKEMKLLEKQGQQTSKAYEEYESTLESARSEVESYKTKIEQNTKAIAENEKQTAQIIKTMNIEDMTMNQLRQRAADLQNQMNNTSQSLSPEAYKKLQKELEQVRDRMGVVGNANKSMLQQFAGMHNLVGSAARAVQGFGQALKLLMANPVVAIIAAVVAVFYALRDALFKNEEAMNSLNRIMAPFKVILDAIINLLQKAVIAILNFIEGIIGGLAKLAENIPFVGKYIKDMNDKAREGIELEKAKQELQRQHRENLVKNAEKEKQIAILRNEAAQKDRYSAKERIAKLKEAIRLEDEIVQSKIEEAKEELRILKIEAARTENAKELNDKIAEQTALITNLETEYYNKTKRDQKQISSAILEIQREGAEAAKKAMENHLKEIDKTLKLEINKLKQSRMQGLITEKEYNDKVEELTIESLNKKMAVKGQEQHQLIEYEAQILDAQIKQQEEADKILLEALKKDKEEKLDLLEGMKNKELEILQETEADQKIYALRAAEIESNYEQLRLDTIRAYGQAVEQAEIQNAKTRENAIHAANEEILKSEAENLKKQANLRKLFARTTADFERQYNIKTWEQRKEDELRILKKQYDNKLISYETFKIAEAAIEKKYEDEKRKIREQIGIGNLKDQYQAEKEALEEKLRQGLITQKEYEQALLELKLKYAAEYAAKAELFAKTGADMVKSMETAETAKLSAEYEKRKSALTEQYNQGIISQEEYNERKEQLDYEEKENALEIQKKYADANFAMQCAEIISGGAVAAINAYKALAGIPVVGPALGAAAAAMVAVTTMMRLKEAKAERDRVKAITMESRSGGNSGAPKTGQIRLKEGYAEGGFNAASAGGYTGAGGKYEVAGFLPYHRGEYIIAQEELQQPAIMDMARSIERERRKRTSKNSVPGFADGGSNTSDRYNSTGIDSGGRINSRILAILQRLEDGDIIVQTNYGVTELEAEQRRKQQFESKFTRK